MSKPFDSLRSVRTLGIRVAWAGVSFIVPTILVGNPTPTPTPMVTTAPSGGGIVVVN